MKLCECGCGNPVTHERNRFLQGHSGGRPPAPIEDNMKLCECGCGKPVTHNKNRFISGHNTNRKGCYHTEEAKLKQSIAHKNISQETRDKMSKAKKGIPSPRKGIKLSADARDIFLVKIKQTCLEKYGTEFWVQTLEGREVLRLHKLKQIADQLNNGEPITPTIGSIEREFLNTLESNIPYTIIRQKPMYGLFPDGYIEEVNVIIEFDESYHLDPAAIAHDKTKNNTYKKYNHTIFRVSEKEWQENPEKIINRFKTLTQRGKTSYEEQAEL